MGHQPERRTFEMIDDEEEEARKDLVKYGNEEDKRDMARMGKIQEMRVSIFFPKRKKKMQVGAWLY